MTKFFLLNKRILTDFFHVNIQLKNYFQKRQKKRVVPAEEQPFIQYFIL